MESQLVVKLGLCLLIILVPLDLVGTVATNSKVDKCPNTKVPIVKIGVVIDHTSRVGKEQRIAMQMAAQQISHSTCLKLELLLKDSKGSPAKATASGNSISISNFSYIIIINLTWY